jgi:hypothetical protein
MLAPSSTKRRVVGVGDNKAACDLACKSMLGEE